MLHIILLYMLNYYTCQVLCIHIIHVMHIIHVKLYCECVFCIKIETFCVLRIANVVHKQDGRNCL